MLVQYVNAYGYIIHHHNMIIYDDIILVFTLISQNCLLRSCRKTADAMRLPLQFYCMDVISLLFSHDLKGKRYFTFFVFV